MKKIGILYGQERTFPQAFIEHGRAQAPEGIHFEAVRLGEVRQGVASEYAVIVDRISQDVPFYRAALKHAALKGCAVINNPFWWSAEDKLTANAMAEEVGVPVPKTVLLPSKRHPDDTSPASFTNLTYPLGWAEMFEHIGFPAFMKPNTGGGWKHVFKVNTPEELFSAYNETGQLNMLLQEAIQFDSYYRCYGIGGKYVRVMPYEPRNAFHERYVRDPAAQPTGAFRERLEQYVLTLCRTLGYDFNTVELAVRDGVPYAIDFTNPAPDADVHSVGQANFEWVVEHAVKYAIERAEAHEPGGDNLTWGTFMQRSISAAGQSASAKTTTPPSGSKASAKTAPASKASAKTGAADSGKSTTAKPNAKPSDSKTKPSDSKGKSSDTKGKASDSKGKSSDSQGKSSDSQAQAAKTDESMQDTGAAKVAATGSNGVKA